MHYLIGVDLPNAHRWVTEFAGYLASSLVLLTFTMQSMRKLRYTAIASNLAFIGYALLGQIHPVLVLHGILLPLNVYRLAEIEIRRHQVRRALPVKAQEA